MWQWWAEGHCPTVVQLSLPSSLPGPLPAIPSPWVGREPAPPAEGKRCQREGRTQSKINTILTAVFYISEHTYSARARPSGVGCKGVN